MDRTTDAPTPAATEHASSVGLSFSQLGAMLHARRLLIGTTLLLSVLITLGLSLVIPKSYQASADLFIDYRASDPITGKLFHPMMDESYMQTQLDIMHSDEVAQKAITASGVLTQAPYLQAVATKGEDRVRGELMQTISKSLEVELRKSSRVVELRFTARSPQQASELLNALLKGYIELANQISSAPARSRQEQYNAQLGVLRAEIDRLQKASTQYQQEHNIVESDERYDNASKQLGEISTRLMEIQAQRSQAASRRHAWEAMLRQGIPPEEVPEVAELKSISDLKLKLSEVEGKLADMSSVMGNNHPRVRATQAERQLLRERLEREARTALNALMADDAKYSEMFGTLQNQMHAQEQGMLEMKKHRDVLGSLQRQQESARRIYDSAAQKYDEILMASAINSPALAVLRWATPPERHSKPKLSLNLIVSVPVGLMLGICLAFLLELANRRLRSVEDLQHDLAMPVLGRAQ